MTENFQVALSIQAQVYHYKAENLNFSKLHKKALMFKVFKRMLTEFMSKLQLKLFVSISGHFDDQSYL